MEINKKPTIGLTVKLYIANKVKRAVGTARGQWDGEKWFMQVPYMNNKFAPMPVHLEVVGWEPIDKKK